MHRAVSERAEREARAARLVEARKAAGFSGAVVAAKRFGWNENTYKAHENGRNGFGLADAKQYAAAFGVSVEWLNFGVGRGPDQIRRVPEGEEFPPDPDPDVPATIGTETGRRGIPANGIAQIDVTAGLGAGGLALTTQVPAGRGMTFAAEVVRDYWRLPGEVLSALGLKAGEIAILPVQGDSMTPTLSDGDFVFIDTRHRVPSPDGVYALADEFGGIVVKRLEVASSPRDEEVTVRVISDNPRHLPKERPLSDVHIVGRVVRRFGVVG